MKFGKKTLGYSSAKSGFTMVELSLTMAFVAVLLITIAVITSNIMTIYQKGLTIKAVNSVGRGLTDEFIAGINTAPAVDTTSLCNGDFLNQSESNAHRVKECKKQHAFKFVYQDRRDEKGRQLNGIFCSGTYSYMWNTYYGLNGPNKSTVSLQYIDTDGNLEKVDKPRLVRIKDPTYRLCTAKLKNDYTSTYEGVSDSFVEADVVFDITRMRNAASSPENPISKPEGGMMLSAFDLDLELYEFTIFPISQDNMTLRTYMSGTFTLATTRGNIDIVRTGDYCQPNSVVDPVTGEVISGDTSSLNDLGSEFNYCAINKFNFAARTAGVD